MSRTFAARVNEKLYHAGLVLGMNSNAGNDTAAKAEAQAQEFAACAFMQAGYVLFVQEVAESCQIQSLVFSAQELKAELAAQSRSHAVVETLLSLEADPNSWLSALHNEYSNFTAGNAGAMAKAAAAKGNVNLISLDTTQQFEAPGVLDAFKAFVSDQREFLQEW